MSRSRKIFGLALLAGISSFLVDETSRAAVVPGWAGTPDPFKSGACWRQDYGKLRFNFVADCDPSLNPSTFHDFDIPVPIKQSPTSGGLADVKVVWTMGDDCTSGLCPGGNFDARVLIFNANGTLATSSAWNGATGTQSSSSMTVPPNGSVQLWVHAQGSPSAGNTKWVSTVWTTGNLSL